MASPYIWGPNSAINLHPNGGEIDAISGRYRLNDGAYNYITNGTFESGITTAPATLETVTVTAGVVSGTPSLGAASLALSAETTAPLLGGTSIRIAAAAGWTNGASVAFPAFTVAPAHLGKVMTFSFYYSAPVGASALGWGGTLGTQNLSVWIYDVTNTVWIQPAGYLNLTQSSGTGFCTGTFQTSVTVGQQYQMFLVNLTNTASTSIAVLLDQVYLGPQTSPMAPAMSDAIPWTPSFTNFGTVTGILCSYYRSGKYLVGNYNFQSGTAVAGVGSFSLPTGLAVDNTVAAGIIEVGGGSTNNTPFAHNIITQTGTSTTLLYFSSAAASYLAPVNGNAWSSLTFFSGTFRIPIVGWSSNSVASSDTDTRIIDMAVQSPGTATTLNTPIVWATVIGDRAGSYNSTTGRYTVPVSGDYVLIGSSSVSSGTPSLQAYRNGSASINIGSSSSSAITAFSGMLLGLSAGDIVDIRPTATVTINGNWQLFRLSGPAVITATESVNARYHSATATITASPSAVTYTAKDFDSHNAYSGSTYTIPVSGKYQINAGLLVGATFTVGQVTAISIFKNAVAVSQIGIYAGGVQGTANPVVSDIISCNAGDSIVIEIVSGGATPTVTSSTTNNYFSISRVGN